MSHPIQAYEIRHGIEWNMAEPGCDPWCARCGSSAFYVRCSNCAGEGYIEDEDWQFGDTTHTCDWCEGRGGHWACISGKEWCEAHPLPGRETITSTAYGKGEYPDVE